MKYRKRDSVQYQLGFADGYEWQADSPIIEKVDFVDPLPVIMEAMRTAQNNPDIVLVRDHCGVTYHFTEQRFVLGNPYSLWPSQAPYCVDPFAAFCLTLPAPTPIVWLAACVGA